MLFFALLFAGLAVFGACVGFGTIGRPMYGQALNSYGWALCINGVALAAYFVFTRVRRSRPARRAARTSALRS
ncbi:hypothetical protein [Methylobacterium sp. P1-11]|uniref:hypothetical protein n=1 Tax=Methylobacterium sp. P1-11 TaxID=2024616 RepID=UPI0011EBD24B|nr:hypothetical protein [Methylobacterium sp. P1-11]